MYADFYVLGEIPIWEERPTLKQTYTHLYKKQTTSTIKTISMKKKHANSSSENKSIYHVKVTLLIQFPYMYPVEAHF